MGAGLSTSLKSPAAVEVGRLFFGCLAIFAMGGVVFGCSAVYGIFYQQHLWLGRCTDDEKAACKGDEESCCGAQLMAVSVTSSVAFFAADASAAIWGEAVDRLTGLKCLGAATALSCFGLMLLGAAVANAVEALTAVALVLVGLAGPGVFQGVFVSVLRNPIPGAPDWLSAQLATTAAASFDLSAVVLRLSIVLRDSAAGMATSLIIWSLFSACVATLVARLIQPLWPVECCSARELCLLNLNEALGKEGEEAVKDPKETESLLKEGHDEDVEGVAPEAAEAADDDEKKACAWLASFGGPLMTAHNVALVCFMSTYTLAATVYLQIHATTFRAAFDKGTAVSLGNTFDACFPIGGFLTCLVFAPAVAYLRPSTLWLCVCSFALTWFVCASVFTLGMQYAAAVLFGPARALMWAVFYRTVSYDALYPEAIVGRSIGYACLFSGLIGDGLAPALISHIAAQQPDNTQYELVSAVANGTSALQPAPHLSDVLGRVASVHNSLMVALVLSALPLPLALARAEGRLKICAGVISSGVAGGGKDSLECVASGHHDCGVKSTGSPHND